MGGLWLEGLRRPGKGGDLRRGFNQVGLLRSFWDEKGRRWVITDGDCCSTKVKFQGMG